MKNSFLENKSIKSFLDFFSRLSISAIFISAIPGKINDFDRTVEYISSKGIPEPISSILLVGAIICLILGSEFFIFGENQKICSVFLLLFIITSVPNKIYCLAGYWIEEVSPGKFESIFYQKTKRKINEYKNNKKEVDEFIKGINLEYKSIKKEINDFF